MALTREILNSHPISTLKKEISKTNIKGYSKMKKDEVVELMMKNKERFGHIKMAEKKKQVSKNDPKVQKIAKDFEKAISKGKDVAERVRKTKDVKPKSAPTLSKNQQLQLRNFADLILSSMNSMAGLFWTIMRFLVPNSVKYELKFGYEPTITPVNFISKNSRKLKPKRFRELKKEIVVVLENVIKRFGNPKNAGQESPYRFFLKDPEKFLNETLDKEDIATGKVYEMGEDYLKTKGKFVNRWIEKTTDNPTPLRVLVNGLIPVWDKVPAS